MKLAIAALLSLPLFAIAQQPVVNDIVIRRAEALSIDLVDLATARFGLTTLRGEALKDLFIKNKIRGARVHIWLKPYFENGQFNQLGVFVMNREACQISVRTGVIANPAVTSEHEFMAAEGFCRDSDTGETRSLTMGVSTTYMHRSYFEVIRQYIGAPPSARR